MAASSHGIGGTVGIQMAVDRNVNGAVQILVAHPGHNFEGLFRRNHAHIQPDAFGPADVALQGLMLQFARGDSQAADFIIGAEVFIQLGTVFSNAHHGGGCVELGQQPHGHAGGPTGEFIFFHQDDIGPAGFGQMIKNTAAGNPTADNDDSGLIFQIFILIVKESVIGE